MKKKPSPKKASKFDLRIVDHGSVVMFHPLNVPMAEWLRASVQADAQWLGGALAVEHRYAEGLYQGLVENGWSVC